MTGAAQIGELSPLIGSEHERPHLGKVLFEQVLRIRLRSPPPAALRSRLAAGSAEQRRIVEQIAAERRDVGFEDRLRIARQRASRSASGLGAIEEEGRAGSVGSPLPGSELAHIDRR